MSRLKKLTVVSTIWNVVLLLLLFFQSSLIYRIVEKNLFPTFGFIKPLVDQNFIAFIKNRVVIAAVTIVFLMLIEIILFFIVNRILQKKYKKISQQQSNTEIAIQSKKSQKYYKYINIYFIIFIFACIVFISYYALSIVSISNEIDFSMNNKTINSVYNIAMEAELSSLKDIKGFIDVSIEKIKSDSEIYSFVVELLSFTDGINYMNRFFYSISYLVLLFGIYKNTRLYLCLDKKEENYE